MSARFIDELEVWKWWNLSHKKNTFEEFKELLMKAGYIIYSIDCEGHCPPSKI